MPRDEALIIFEEFLRNAPQGAEKLLLALSVAESLTDDVAREIYSRYPIDGVEFDLFLRALRSSGLITPRNSEWHLNVSVRENLFRRAISQKQMFEDVNLFLLSVANTASDKEYGSKVPRYLGTGAGLAYHKVGVNPEKNTHLYTTQVSYTETCGELWLAVELSGLQAKAGLIDRNAIEPAFLRGLLLYREGKRNEAVKYLSMVADSEEERSEVSVACHLSGVIFSQRKPSIAQRYLRKGLRLSSKVHDWPGQAKIAHTLSNLIGRSNAGEAMELLHLSISIDKERGNLTGEAQARQSLARLLETLKLDGAEDQLRESVRLDAEAGNQLGTAKSLHSLGNLIQTSNRAEAERLLRQSLAIGTEIGHKRHIAQVARSLGRLLQSKNDVEAEKYFRMSISHNEDMKDWEGLRLATTSLEKLLKARRRPLKR